MLYIFIRQYNNFYFCEFLINMKRKLYILPGAFLVLSLILLSAGCTKTSYSSDQYEIYKVSKKNIKFVVSETAGIGSESENIVTAAFSSKIENLLDEGVYVKKGTIAGNLSIAKELSEKEKSEMALKESEFNLKITQIENEKELYRLSMEMGNAKLELEKAKLQLKKLTDGRDGLGIINAEESLATIKKELAIYELDIPEKERLYNSGYLPEDDLNQAKTKYEELKKLNIQTEVKLRILEKGPAEEEVEKEKINVKIAREKFEKSAEEFKTYKNTAEINIKDNLGKIAKNTDSLKYYSDLVRRGNLVATGDGLIIYGKMYVGREEVKIKAGDSVREGVEVAKIIDINKPVLKMFVNEVDIGKLKVGQEADFYLDSFPDKKYRGKVIKIASIASNKFERDKNDVKVFETKLRIFDKDQNLKPGMTANVEVIIDKLENIIVVPSQAIIKNEGKTYCFVEKDGNFIKQQVTTGKSNELETIIIKGLNEGDKIALKALEVRTE